MTFSFMKHHTSLQFFKTTSDEVEQVEGELGIAFPPELKLFLMTIGYGSFVGEDELDENCILSPASIRDFRLSQGFFDAYPNSHEEHKLVFFMGWESVPFSIELTEREQNPIYANEKKIANSFAEFIAKIIEEPEYFQQD